MARRRRYYRVRVTKPKWSSIIKNIEIDQPNIPTNQYSIFGSLICGNATNGDVVAQPVIKTAWFRAKGTITAASNTGVFNPNISFMVAIMYIPEGISMTLTGGGLSVVDQSIAFTHPEWILGWRRYDFIDAGQINEFSITSRLKRNLNKGDTVQLVVIGMNASAGGSGAYHVSCTCSYACRAN